MRILILGGTAEARQLADRLVALGHDVITSLAGRTREPILPQGEVRTGPFGGVPGLGAYLRAARIDRLVDATHPYAGTISRHAVAAAREAGVRLVRYMRPPWTPLPGQSWIVVDTPREAADSWPAGAAILLTTGHAGLEIYLQRDDCRLHLRMIEPPEIALPPHAELILSRPPFSLAEEMALMRRHGITHLVSKNSGGAQTSAKLEAARQLGVEIIMLARPAYGPAHEVDSVEAAIEALELPGRA